MDLASRLRRLNADAQAEVITRLNETGIDLDTIPLQTWEDILSDVEDLNI